MRLGKRASRFTAESAPAAKHACAERGRGRLFGCSPDATRTPLILWNLRTSHPVRPKRESATAGVPSKHQASHFGPESQDLRYPDCNLPIKLRDLSFSLRVGHSHGGHLAAPAQLPPLSSSEFQTTGGDACFSSRSVATQKRSA